MRARTIAYVSQVARTGQGINQAFGTQAPMCWPSIEADLRHAWFRANWIDASLTNRFVELTRVVGSRAKLRWLLPRVGGLATLRVQRAISASLRRAR